MSDFEPHTRTVIVDGMAVRQRIAIERITTEDELITTIQAQAVARGVFLPYHPEVSVLAHKTVGAVLKVMLVVHARIDRAAIDCREVRAWKPDDRFIIAVPPRVFLLKFAHGRYEDGSCFFIKRVQQPAPQAGYNPKLYTSIVPNQCLAGRICSGAVLRDFACTTPAQAIQAARMLVNESAYNNHFHELYSWKPSPFSGALPAGFAVPESLADAHVFKEPPTEAYAHVLEQGVVMLWHFCRWQAWTEQHIMSWQQDIDELVVGDSMGTAQTMWDAF